MLLWGRPRERATTREPGGHSTREVGGHGHRAWRHRAGCVAGSAPQRLRSRCTVLWVPEGHSRHHLCAAAAPERRCHGLSGHRTDRRTCLPAFPPPSLFFSLQAVTSSYCDPDRPAAVTATPAGKHMVRALRLHAPQRRAGRPPAHALSSVWAPGCTRPVPRCCLGLSALRATLLVTVCASNTQRGVGWWASSYRLRLRLRALAVGEPVCE